MLDWQKEELAQEKQLTYRILIQAVHGNRLRKEFVEHSMVLRNLIILPEAEQDAAQAYIWYEQHGKNESSSDRSSPNFDFRSWSFTVLAAIASLINLSP